MTHPLYAVYGASGHGREIMPLARSTLMEMGISSDRLVFVDDNPPASEMNGHRVLSFAQFLAEEATDRHAALAIANSQIREKLAAQCAAATVLPWAITASNVVLMDEVKLGVGALLSPFVTLTSNIRIGDFFHANVASRVAHDCVIGNYVTFAPSVQCNGNVLIEDHAYIGTGAILRQGKPGKPLVIGRGAVVGMGAVVTKDVPPGMTVVGNPARSLVKD